jgi:hypothetical protein
MDRVITLGIEETRADDAPLKQPLDGAGLPAVEPPLDRHDVTV